MPGPQRSNIIASKDTWFPPPILAKTGPDGALWVLDWYNYLFLHNPATPAGDGKAWIGRKLRYKTRSPHQARDPSGQRPRAHPQPDPARFPSWWPPSPIRISTGASRPSACSSKRARPTSSALLLRPILKGDHSVDAVDNNPRVVHALWTFSAWAASRPMPPGTASWMRFCSIPPGECANVLQAMPRNPASARPSARRCAVNDGHGHVRLPALVALCEISSKPAGLPAMWDTYRSVDSLAQKAFTAAGITSAATRPCQPALLPVSAPQAQRIAQPRSDLRIIVSRGGFQLQPHGQLPDGEFTVSDARGRMSIPLELQRPGGALEPPDGRRTRATTYVYTFQGRDGSLMQGRLDLGGRDIAGGIGDGRRRD